MTQDEPERDYGNLLRDYHAAIERISVSEKRADEAEFKLADDQFWKLKSEQAESERDSSQASLLRVVEALKRMITLAEDAGTYVPDSIRLTLCESTGK